MQPEALICSDFLKMRIHVRAGKINCLNLYRAPLQRLRARDHQNIVNAPDFPQCSRCTFRGVANKRNSLQEIDLPEWYGGRVAENYFSYPLEYLAGLLKSNRTNRSQGTSPAINRDFFSALGSLVVSKRTNTASFRARYCVISGR